VRLRTFVGFSDAYAAVLDEVVNRPEYEIAPRGMPSLERLDVSFRLLEPRRRLPYLPSRKVNVIFHLAETLWYLSGRRDLAMPAYYAPRMAGFSVDGKTLSGTAYGPPLREQWDRVAALLERDPDTKRAVITFFRPAELIGADNPDVSCAVAAQFLLRDGRLNMSVFMRGNDAYRGMVGDVFAFTFIQEFMATQLGVSLGAYAHHVGSMHVNMADLPEAKRVIGQRARNVTMLPMPADTIWADLEAVCEQEEALRTGRTTHTFETIGALKMPPYWHQLVLIFELYRRIKHEPDRQLDPFTLSRLYPGYRWLITRRWPDRMAEGPM
jgi:thymidylate synthase